jgi:hypothetical protein
VVNKEPSANCGSGVNFDTGQEAVDVGQDTSQESQLVSPQEVGGAVKPEGMEARIAEDDLQHASRCRVFSKYRLNIFS